MALVLGIDDAGRGPLIGPMFLAGVLMKKEDESLLREAGVKDSKQVPHPIRVRLAGLIQDTAVKFKVVQVEPEQIDHSLNSGVNLNTLEAIKTAEIINILTQGIKEKIQVIIDCPSVNIKAWRAALLTYIKYQENLEIICEHKADINHVAVSAASILAKVAREAEVEKLKKKYGQIGSGYLSDPETILFLKNQGQILKDSGLFRKTWVTWQNHLAEKEQKKLEDFSEKS